MSFVSLTLPCEMSAPHPAFAEIFLEAAAPPQPIVRAVPFEEPGKSGPKTLLYKAAQGSMDIRSLLPSPKPDAKDIAKKDEERLLKEQKEAEERVNQDAEVRRSLETADFIDTNASIDTSKAKTAGFRGLTRQ